MNKILSSGCSNPPDITPSSKASPLNILQSLLQKDLGEVNKVIMLNVNSDIELIPQLASYLISSGGKRIRPLLTLATAKLVGYTGQKHIALAACVEFIHSATLLHDDVVDESKLRRNQATANIIWGNKSSILVGDFLFSKAFKLMVAQNNLGVLEVLADAANQISEGEVHQLAAQHNLHMTSEEYIAIITAKTAALFRAACEVSGILGDLPAEQINALAEYGKNLGIVFQIIDDLLDYCAEPNQLGKQIGDDFREGKITLPVLFSYNRHANSHSNISSHREFWYRTMVEGIQNPTDFEYACTLVRSEEQNILDFASNYVTLAVKNLELLSSYDAISPFESGLSCRGLLSELCYYLLSRKA